MHPWSPYAALGRVTVNAGTAFEDWERTAQIWEAVAEDNELETHDVSGLATSRKEFQ